MYSSRYAGLVFWNIIRKRNVYQGIWSTILLGFAPARGHTTVEVTKLLLIGDRALSAVVEGICFFLAYCAGLLLFQGTPELVALGLIYLVQVGQR